MSELNGPLFGWKPAARPPEPVLDRSTGPELIAEENQPVASGPSGPVRTPEFSNDSSPSGRTPYRGNQPVQIHPSCSPSAALRSAARGRENSGWSGGDPGHETSETIAGPTPRPYQVQALAAIDHEFELGRKRTLVVLPTGTGKTVVFARWAAMRVALGRRVLVLAHRTELLKQACSKLRDVGVWAAIEKAEQRAGLASVIVGSVQTVQRKRLEALDPDAFDLVVDEAHHAPAASYGAILSHFPNALVLGVTATADRADGKALGKHFESVAYRYELRQAIREEFLVPIVARRIFVESVDLSAVKSRAGDLATDELAAVMATDAAILGVVIPLLEQAGDRRTIVFAVDVAHAFALAEAIRDRRPGAARVGHGEMGDDERTELLDDFRAGRFQFLINCQLFTEGFDEPSIGCVACCRPTKSRVLYTQQVGRGTRLLGATLAESIANGKPNVLVLDFVGNTGRHRLVGPLDALAAGEDMGDDVRKEAERMLEDGEQDLDALLDDAKAELERKRKEIREGANARYFHRDIDPFFGEELGPECTEPWAFEPATFEQIRVLEDIGLKKLPPSLTRGEATRFVAAHLERRRLGLATYKQSKLLARFGYDTKTMTKTSATARIGALATNDFDPARARAQLQRIEANELLAKGRPS